MAQQTSAEGLGVRPISLRLDERDERVAYGIAYLSPPVYDCRVMDVRISPGGTYATVALNGRGAHALKSIADLMHLSGEADWTRQP